MPRKGKGRTSAASADSSQQPTSTSDRGAGSRSVRYGTHAESTRMLLLLACVRVQLRRGLRRFDTSLAPPTHRKTPPPPPPPPHILILICKRCAFVDDDAGGGALSALTKGPADTQVPLPLSDKLSVLQGKINHMGPAQIRRELKLRGKCEQGEVKVLRARLKHQVLLQKLGEHFDDSDQSSVAAKKAAASARSTASPPPAMICVMDFEATCIEEDPGRCFPNEIIEFPVVLVDRETRTVVAEFQRYVKPTNNPVLSSFCTRLTGITQEQVDGAAPFPVVFEEMLSWLKGLGHLPGDGGGGGGDNGDGADGESAGGGGAGGEGASVGPMCIFATDGPWDIRDFLRMQFKMSGLGM